MADPLLSTLCTICRINQPKYVCPACSAGTCSLACNQKHKSWANCSGKRDPTAYMPVSKLKTPAGVDHDYNFLSSIERERDRNQREIVEEKGLFSGKELREMEGEKRWRKMWFGEEVRFVANVGDRSRNVPRGFGSDGEEEKEEGEGDGNHNNNNNHNTNNHGGRGKVSALARKIRARLDQAGIEVVQMPMGMVRQRENTTAWNRRTGGINWCVEWILPEADDTTGGKKNMRIRHKALETTPLYKALGNTLAWHRRGQQKEEQEEEDDDEEMMSVYARKRRRVLIKEVKEEGRRSAMQDQDDETWFGTTPYPTQNPYTGTWDLDRSATATSWLPDEEIDARRHHRFYLLKPMTPAGKPKELIPLESTETLGKALQGRSVLEYPTIYILPPGTSAEEDPSTTLPEGYVLGSTERRQRQRKPRPEKRKAVDKKSDRPQKRQAITAGDDDDENNDGGNDHHLPIRARPGQQRGGRGGGGVRGARGARGRGVGRGGGRFQNRNAHPRDTEEGEINSDGDEVTADTSSSDPDTSSDEEEEEEEGETKPHPAFTKTPGLGLLEYGSDSDSEEELEEEDIDISKLQPENPELVANAIQEIVGLLT